jgi:hypothetical protein
LSRRDALSGALAERAGQGANPQYLFHRLEFDGQAIIIQNVEPKRMAIGREADAKFFELFAALTFKIVQLRKDSLTTTGREWTRRNGLIRVHLVSIRRSFFLPFGWAYSPLY